jgi:hypothetical protein
VDGLEASHDNRGVSAFLTIVLSRALQGELSFNFLVYAGTIGLGKDGFSGDVTTSSRNRNPTSPFRTWYRYFVTQTK